jgi:hypothetical protein
VQIATRIAKAWDQLATQVLAAASPVDGLRAMQRWISSSAPSVSRLTAEALAADSVVQMFLAAEVGTLPVRAAAWQRLRSALEAPKLPRDPVAFARLISDHADAVVMYVTDSYGPPVQDELEAWWSPSRQQIVWGGRVHGGLLDADGSEWDGDVAELMPATRAQIITCVGDQELLRQ